MNAIPNDVCRLAKVTDLHDAVVRDFCQLVATTLEHQDRFSVSLSGGSTPKRIYEMLSEKELPWQKIHFFWGDERNVPHQDDDSNAKMVATALLDRVDIPADNIHRVPVIVDDPATAAKQYEETLRIFFADQDFPVWDLNLLGMGDDAHTASLFPGTHAIGENKRWFVENYVEKLSTFRYTLTAPAINSAKQKWFMVAGENKRTALSQVWSSEKNVDAFPSQLIQNANWYVTDDAMPTQ